MRGNLDNAFIRRFESIISVPMPQPVVETPGSFLSFSSVTVWAVNADDARPLELATVEPVLPAA